MKWNADGLIAAIVQEASGGEVRMLGWMNAEALKRTEDTGDVWFWSRSRQTLWRKGESSGNTLRVVSLRVDCDRDAVLIRAKCAGPTCHTGQPSCFFETIAGSEDGEEAHAIDRLARTIDQRRDADAGESYTAKLLSKGIDSINAKISEEAGELSEALNAETDERVIDEAADVIYHLLVGLTARGLSATDVWAELDRRSGVSGLVEKAQRS